MQFYKDKMRVKNPEKLPGKISCKRMQLGGLGANKPNVIKFADGELLLATFHKHCEPYEDGVCTIHIMLYRSGNNGVTWSGRHYDNLWGKEPYLNVFGDDTVIMTTHHLQGEVRNRIGRTVTVLHRSEDRGETWKSTTIDKDDIPDEVDMTYSSRNIIELDNGVLLMGMGCGYGKDYAFKSFDMGKTWKPFSTVFYGYERDKYRYSPYQEAVFWKTEQVRLFLLARCSPELMVFTEKIDGLPDFDYSTAKGFDHFDVEILFESQDSGLSWHPIKAINILSAMYPSIIQLDDGRTLFTFTVREPLEGNHMGIQAIIVTEDENGNPKFDIASDRIIIDEKTPDYLQSGGGFGNTLQLDDGNLLTVYSYYDADEEIKLEMEDGTYFADEEKFEKVRRKAAEFHDWANGFNYNSLKDKVKNTRRHCYLGCWQVLRKAGPKTEITLWRLPVD